jgi:hypothetical protein
VGKEAKTNLTGPVVLADVEDLVRVRLHPSDVLFEEPLEGGVEVVGARNGGTVSFYAKKDKGKKRTHTRSTSSTFTPVLAKLPP